MRKYIAVFFLAVSVLACGQWQSPQQIATQTAAAATAAAGAATATAAAATATAASWTKTPTPTKVPTATPDFNASLPYFYADVYQGPNLNYPMIGMTLNAVTIYGQAYACSWFKVSANVDGNLESGWIEADKLTYTVKCSDVEIAEIPPMPTSTPFATSTRTPRPRPVATLPPPSTPTPACETSSIEIQNDTGGSISIILTGPYYYEFWLGTGTQNISVCPGTYNYTAYGCGSNANGTMSTGESHRFYCQ